MTRNELATMLEGYASCSESDVLVGSYEALMEVPRWDKIKHVLDVLGHELDPHDVVPVSDDIGLTMLAALLRNEFFAFDSGMSRQESRMLASQFVETCFFEHPRFYTLGQFLEFEEHIDGRVTYSRARCSPLSRNGGYEMGLFIVDEVQVGLVCVSDFF